jgi:copper chaperone NosL
MKGFVLLISTFWIISCSVKPEPIVYGKDGCHACKMTLMDPKYGAELVTGKGKIYKFDDVNCLAGFVNSGFLSQEEIAQLWVIDFSMPKTLIRVEDALFIHSDDLKTPMASGVAAFGSKKLLDEYNREIKGSAITWNEVLQKFNHP